MKWSMIAQLYSLCLPDAPQGQHNIAKFCSKSLEPNQNTDGEEGRDEFGPHALSLSALATRLQKNFRWDPETFNPATSGRNLTAWKWRIWKQKQPMEFTASCIWHRWSPIQTSGRSLVRVFNHGPNFKNFWQLDKLWMSTGSTSLFFFSFYSIKTRRSINCRLFKALLIMKNKI